LGAMRRWAANCGRPGFSRNVYDMKRDSSIWLLLLFRDLSFRKSELRGWEVLYSFFSPVYT
jgi:hypothetical protein